MLCLNSTGTCVASENEASWYVEPCECTEGWTGELCDEDIDGCAENPCYALCTDVVASKVMSYTMLPRSNMCLQKVNLLRLLALNSVQIYFFDIIYICWI